jgi:hypothetical protein
VTAAVVLADDRLQRLLRLWTRGMLLAKAIAADRRHRLTAIARAVKTTTTRETKKARATRARAIRARAARALTKTSPRKEGYD